MNSQEFDCFLTLVPDLKMNWCYGEPILKVGVYMRQMTSRVHVIVQHQLDAVFSGVNVTIVIAPRIVMNSLMPLSIVTHHLYLMVRNICFCHVI